jgi:hypothetical protein
MAKATHSVTHLLCYDVAVQLSNNDMRLSIHDLADELLWDEPPKKNKSGSLMRCFETRNN